MSYKLYSRMTGHQHDVIQWEARSLEGELSSFKGRTIIDQFNKYFSKSNIRILEGGCGLGAWCEWFNRRGQICIGIEYDASIVKKALNAKPDIPVLLGDITTLEYEDNSFDGYISLGVIEHFEHGPEKALSEAIRLLKKDGIGVFTTPLLSVMRRAITHPLRSTYFFIQKIRGKECHFWEYRFTKNELKKYLEDAGFTVLFEGIDDYHDTIPDRHIGLWADWFFLRSKSGQIYKLNAIGRTLKKFLNFFPSDWYCSGYVIVVTPRK